MAQVTTQSVLFGKDLFKPVAVAFDQPDSSSDGGAILLKTIDSQLSLTDRLVKCIRDSRQAGKVVHSHSDLLRQRIYGIASGDLDCNDADALATDPAQKLLLNRDPIDGQDLGSQPTLSRFENSPSSKELFRMGGELADVVRNLTLKELEVKQTAITEEGLARFHMIAPSITVNVVRPPNP